MAETTAVLMEAVEEVARRAGAVALRYFGRGVTVESKNDGSPVTIADRAAEQAAREWIAARFPEDGILGEEMGESDPGGTRRWIIDPIDGTRTFVRGVPLWGTLVAVCEGRDVLAGAAFFPALGEMLVAGKGCGCWWNGARAHVSTVDDMAQATVLTTDDEFRACLSRRDSWRTLSSSAAMARSWGDCYGYLLVATGRAEVMVDPILAPWDAAAFAPAITEAGGVFTDWDGAATAFGGSAVATNAALASAARECLTGAER